MRLFLLFTGILTFSIHVIVTFLDVVYVVAPVSMLFSMRAAAPNDTNSSGTQLESVQCPFVCMYATQMLASRKQAFMVQAQASETLVLTL